MLIDTHFHCFTRTLPVVQGARYQPYDDADFSALQALWQTHGIDRGVIVQPSFLGTDNTYLLQLCERFPLDLRGVAVVSSNISYEALAQMHASGVRGIRFNWVGGHDWPDVAGANWNHVRHSLQTLGMHVQLHVEGARLAQAAQQFDNWQVPLVMDHLGRPDSASSVQTHLHVLQQLAKRRNLRIKLSAPYRCGSTFHEVAHALITTLGAAHLLWGSDWPFTQHEATQDYAAQISTLNAAVPDAAIKKAIMQTAQSLYFL